MVGKLTLVFLDFLAVFRASFASMFAIWLPTPKHLIIFCKQIINTVTILIIKCFFLVCAMQLIDVLCYFHLVLCRL